MNKAEENLSQSKYAEHRNVTKGYIGRIIKEGRLHLIKGKLNVEMSDAELDNKSKFLMIRLRIIGEKKRYMKGKQNVSLQNWI